MMYAKVINGTVTYPYTRLMFLADNPNTSIGDTTSIDIAEFNVVAVAPATEPAYDPMTQSIAEGTPVEIMGVWTQQWTLRAMTAEELATAAQALQDSIVNATQERLDAFARARNYDSILSACTYASSTIPKFAAEGQYCVNARDQTWDSLYTLLANVQAGEWQAPTSFDDVEPLLPQLTWPL